MGGKSRVFTVMAMVHRLSGLAEPEGNFPLVSYGKTIVLKSEANGKGTHRKPLVPQLRLLLDCIKTAEPQKTPFPLRKKILTQVSQTSPLQGWESLSTT